MGFVSALLGIIGFAIGIPIGFLLGFFIFIYFDPGDVKEPTVRPLHEFDKSSLIDISSEIPMWVKHPDYDRIDWLNKYVSYMWPYIDKAICGMLRSTMSPIFAEYSRKFHFKSVDFQSLSLGSFPPIISGVKVHDTNEKETVIETALRWAGNLNITLMLNFLSLPIRVQLFDVQVSAAPRITLKPLVPTFPCFASINLSLLEKPHVDFGMKVLGADIMAIPGVYQFVQELIGKQIASLYLWPQALGIHVLDGSVEAMKKPVGIVNVKVVRALNLRKMDLFGSSDPYVKLRLSGEILPAKRTSIKMNNLNPEWNEVFKLTVKDPESQVLKLQLYDWEKVGPHDKLGMQVVPLRLLTPHETKEFTLDLVKNLNLNDPQNRKPWGKLVVEITFSPFREDDEDFSGSLEGNVSKERAGLHVSNEASVCRGGLLLVTIIGAEDVEGKCHNNPYALIMFRGEQKKTKAVKKTRDPVWNEEFQFVLEDAPLKEKIHIEVISKRKGLSFRPKETLGYVDINLNDVVHNVHINEKYHLINSKKGVLCVDIRWRVI